MREAGATHLNQFNQHGRTALHIACSTGNKVFARVLVQEIYALGDPDEVDEGVLPSDSPPVHIIHRTRLQ